MAMPFDHADLAKLKGFVEFVGSNPTILNMPQLSFVKQFIEQFGGKVPAGDFKMPGAGKCPFGGAKAETKPEVPSEESEDEVLSDSEPESELELNMEGVIEADTDADQPMGDAAKSPTEEEIDRASELRSKAAAAYADNNVQEAIDLYTQAIELNPGNALFHAKRGQAFLKLKKPNACIRDCNKALELNCDSAAAYKFRGRAQRLLGRWEEAAKDLRQACKLDFDEETDEWLREVQPNAQKIEQHRIKQERRKVERLAKQREAAKRKSQKQQQKTAGAAGAGAGTGTGGFGGGGGAGGFGGMPNFNIGDIMSDLQDPELSAALEDILKDPSNINKYKNNPKITRLIETMKQMQGTGMGFPGAFGGGFPGAGAGAEPDLGSTSATPPPEPTATAGANDEKTTKKSPNFVDDGLD